MGHDVKYFGKLRLLKALSDEEKITLNHLKNQGEYDRLYALEYEDDYFYIDDSNEKLYPTSLYNSIERYINKLKEGGNDLVEGSYLVSCSEYGLDHEAIILIYKNGSFMKKDVISLINEFINK